MPPEFSYQSAFARNIGWVTPQEQEMLRGKCVAIAGMGGVGGVHLLTLARLGIGRFHIADLDVFDIVNLNRQVGASMSTIGQKKVDVMARMVKDINPEIDVRIFPEGVSADNLADFLADVDLYVDGLDFFAFSAREATFSACARHGIPAITAAPIGMGTAVLNFLPGGMTFEEYFQFEGRSEEEKAFRFLLGLSPAMLQRPYLVDPSAVDLAQHRGPSTPMACQLCAGTAATEALKILLNRGKVIAAPRGFHFDAYRNKLAYTWRPWGNRNPIQRIALSIAKRQLGTPPGPPTTRVASGLPAATEQILDLARWAPSGDNTQPWRFEVVDDKHFAVHGFDTRESCLYDFNGHSSHMAHGALLETISIAASAHGLEANVHRRPGSVDEKPIYDVELISRDDIRPSPLLPYIEVRSVQRRPMATRPLTARERHELEASVGDKFDLLWLEGWTNRWRASLLMLKNGRLRLTTPEAYEIHKDVIQQGARISDDRIPDKAVGLDPLTTQLMHLTMKSWRRVDFFNKFLAGTWLPGIELDLIPSLACSAHFVMLARSRPEQIDDYVEAGRAMQRFWLTATKLGLRLQPEMTPLIFSRYVREEVRFSESQPSWERAQSVASSLERLIGPQAGPLAVVMGRLGPGPAPKARSTRLPLARLMRD